MKCQIAIVGLALAVAGTVCAQTYINNEVVRVPPMDPAKAIVQAATFINNNEWDIGYTNLLITYQTWNPQGTMHFQNNGLMRGMPGLSLTYSTTSARDRSAATFVNDGQIDVWSISSYYDFFYSGTVPVVPRYPSLKVFAHNLTNRGTINVGFNGFANLRGTNVVLNEGSIIMETINPYADPNEPQVAWDGYWEVGTNVFGNAAPAAAYFEMPPQSTPLHQVYTRDNYYQLVQLAGTNVLSYVQELMDASGSNRYVSAVFVANTNSSVTPKVFFQGFLQGNVLVELESNITNKQQVITTYVYIEDSFGSGTPQALIPNNPPYNDLTFRPLNYEVYSRATSLIAGPGAPITVVQPGTFYSTATNAFQWTAYQAKFTPLSQLLSDVYGQDITNAPARVEISATNYLEMRNSAITSGSYLLLRGTNHFGGSEGSQIAAPTADIYLRVTNGTMTVTNLMEPFVVKNEGTVDLWSGRWQNVQAGITNHFSVLYVDAKLLGVTPTRIQDLRLTVTNLVNPGSGTDSLFVHDTLNVTRSMVFDVDRLTIGTNDLDTVPATVAGGVHLLNSDVIWANSTPRLAYLTNRGTIQSYNSIYFGRGANTPYFAGDDKPYMVLHNEGGITNSGSQIHAVEFLNCGSFHAATGPISLEECVAGIVTNGTFSAPAGAVSLYAGTLMISNSFINAGNALALFVTNSLDDGTAFTVSGGVTNYPHADGVTNKNYWVAGRQGITLGRLPGQASLLATTISNNIVTAVGTPTSPITWAGANRGKSTAGYTNNAGLGRLILDGGPVGRFQFKPMPGQTNALYVDQIELFNSATNRDAAGNFTRLLVDANMTVYFGNALANGVSVAEKLDGTAGGRFVWMASYNDGFYSSKFVVNPETGETNRLNTALVESCTLDSDGDGIVNCQDLTPVILGPSGGSAVFASAARTHITISWIAPAYSTNQLYFADSLTSTNWQLITNSFTSPGGISSPTNKLVLGPVGGQVKVTEAVPASGQRFYRPSVRQQ